MPPRSPRRGSLEGRKGAGGPFGSYLDKAFIKRQGGLTMGLGMDILRVCLSSLLSLRTPPYIFVPTGSRGGERGDVL